MRAVIALAVSLAAIAPARADNRAEAERYFALGEKAYKMQNFLAAAKSFEKSYAALALPEIAFSAAQAYRRQYQIDHDAHYLARAIMLFEKYLAKIKTGGRVADAADALEDLERERARLIKAGVRIEGDMAEKPRTCIGVNVVFGASEASHATSTGMHEVSDAAPSATDVTWRTFVDGKPLQPFEQSDVEAGKPHELRVEADGYVPIVETVAPRAGDCSYLNVTLVPKPARVSVAVESGARVALDGRPIGIVPLPPLEMPAGKHVLAITRLGRVPIVREVVVRRGQELAVHDKLAMTTRRRAVPWLVGTAGALAVVSLASGITAGVFARDAYNLDKRFNSEGNASTKDLQSYQDDKLGRDTARAICGGTAAGAVVIGGLAALLYVGDNPSPERLRVVPTGAGVALTGGF